MIVSIARLCGLVLLIALVGCVGGKNSVTLQPGGEVETIAFYVASHQQDCIGVVPQKCLLVREAPDEPWTLFYDSIEGFEYVEGHEYELLVTREEVPNPPADASSLRYRLVQIVNQTLVLNLESTPWQLESYRDADGALSETIEGSAITAFFEEGRVAGSAGCNRYFASYELTADVLSIGMAGATKMYCAQEGVMQQEQHYLSQLQAVQSYRIHKQQLELADATGTVLLSFRWQPEP